MLTVEFGHDSVIASKRPCSFWLDPRSMNRLAWNSSTSRSTRRTSTRSQWPCVSSRILLSGDAAVDTGTVTCRMVRSPACSDLRAERTAIAASTTPRPSRVGTAHANSERHFGMDAAGHQEPLAGSPQHTRARDSLSLATSLLNCTQPVLHLLHGGVAHAHGRSAGNLTAYAPPKLLIILHTRCIMSVFPH